ncbi:MAG: hypothetical protein COS20_01185 [Gallionellaceae bacterium CG02_land_8_20_14_3_00_60_115]|nr:MAG: hypothetical protein COS20_01185 [Gallionellaceae bacterium CG02_land_8_20_14_3_00_60_115]
MTARVRLNAADMSKRKGYRVPLTAIFQQGEQAALWVVAADNTISLRRVNVAAYLDEGALISGGIEAGERIVSAGVHKLTAGEQIRPFISGNAQ